MRGECRGQEGVITAIDPTRNQVIVGGLNVVHMNIQKVIRPANWVGSSKNSRNAENARRSKVSRSTVST